MGAGWIDIQVIVREVVGWRVEKSFPPAWSVEFSLI